jgi:hypothetical protein
VILLGAGLVAAALNNRHQLALWTLGAAVAIAIPMAIVSIADLRIDGDYGEVREKPVVADSIPGDGYQLAAGTGTIFSYVVHHHPPVSGRKAPFVVALIELSEGVRMLGELVGDDRLDPEAVRIGAPVEVVWQEIDDDLTLPAWRIGAGR